MSIGDGFMHVLTNVWLKLAFECAYEVSPLRSKRVPAFLHMFLIISVTLYNKLNVNFEE